MKADLLEKIAEIIADYRSVEIGQPSVAHVERWVDQFEPDVRVPILQEVSHVLEQTYVSKQTWVEFLRELTTNERLCGDDAKKFWQSTRLLQIQKAGNSQNEM